MNGYINIDLFTYVQFFSDSDRYPLRGKDEWTLKKNYARTTTFKFCYLRSWTCGTLYHCLGQATTIASFKKGVREFLDGNVWDFFLILLIVFLYISQYASFEFLIVCLLNLVFTIWIFFGRWSVFYGAWTLLQTVRKVIPFFLSLTWSLFHQIVIIFFKRCVKSMLLIFCIAWQLQEIFYSDLPAESYFQINP